MKRKYLAIIYLFILSIGTILSLYIPKNEVTANDALVIPNDAIRLRILANSDTTKDQDIKRMVRDEVNEEITKWVSELTSKEEAREVIKAGIPEIQRLAEQVLQHKNVNQTVKVEFGKVEFPTKLYGQFLYPAGQYEAILITLGEGIGANWWCVLFPPLCFLDFSNGVAVSEGFDEEEEQTSDNADKKPAEKKKDRNEKSAAESNQPNVSHEQTVSSEKVIETEADDAQNKSSVEKGKFQDKSIDENAESPVESTVKEDEPEAAMEETKEQPASENAEAGEQQAAPAYTGEDEQPVEVKFFVKEIWNKLFG